MKKLFLCVFCGAFSSSLVGIDAIAQEAKPNHEVTFNVGGVSDYRYRGISQSRLKPALQGGADYVNNPTGFYAGTWLSTIKWTKDAGGGGDVEMDIYAGKRGEIAKDMSYDIGVLSYVYPSNGLGKVPNFVDANTTEVYGQFIHGPAYVKYSYATSNLFGFVNSKGSSYWDISTNPEVGNGFILNLHVGHQSVKNNNTYAYSDWKIGLTKEFFGVNMSVAVIGTNANEKLYVTPSNKFTGKSALLISAVKNF
jgi:uncharacterized protein (TIGR02001 family)